MNRRQFLGVIGAGAAGVAASETAWGKTHRKPNIVFILADDLGRHQLRCYGNPFYETPNIDSLASQGVKFSNAYAACPVCSPTRASIMTGTYPARLHITDYIPGNPFPYAKLKTPDWRKELPSEEVTLAEMLKGAASLRAAQLRRGQHPVARKRRGAVDPLDARQVGLEPDRRREEARHFTLDPVAQDAPARYHASGGHGDMTFDFI